MERRSCEDNVFSMENPKSKGPNSLKKHQTALLLQYADLHIVILLFTKFHPNPRKGLGGVAKTMYFA